MAEVRIEKCVMLGSRGIHAQLGHIILVSLIQYQSHYETHIHARAKLILIPMIHLKFNNNCLLHPGLRIRNYFLQIRISLFFNADPDPALKKFVQNFLMKSLLELNKSTKK